MTLRYSRATEQNRGEGEPRFASGHRFGLKISAGVYDMNNSRPTAKHRTLSTIGVLLAALISASAAAGNAAERYDPLKALEKYHVTWDSPSRDARGSMPAGNGDISPKVWVRETC